jgi:Tfp pilus assembly protein PilP
MMTTRARSIFLVAVFAALAAAPVAGAQAPPPAKQSGKQPAPSAPTTGTAPAPGSPAGTGGVQPTTPAVDLPAPPANYEYSVDGRRDPFLNLVNRGADPRSTGNQPIKRAEGVPGLMTSEITVRGIVQTRGAWVAMVAGIDGKVYSVRAGDKLADGVVREVTPQAVVILQEVNDPLSLAKQREVRKLLRGGEEVK